VVAGRSRTRDTWIERVLAAAEALARYKLRTSLSILGVILGVAAVIAMMSVGEGARRQALEQVERLGLGNVVVRNRTATDGSNGQGLVLADAATLRALVPLVGHASPLVQRYGAVARNGKVVHTQVVGVSANYQSILGLSVSQGRFLSSLDEQRSARVCVIGARLARALFGYEETLGRHVNIGGDYCQVIGVLTAHAAGANTIGALAWRDLDQTALIPLSAAVGRGGATSGLMRADELWLQASEPDRVSDLGLLIARALRRAPETFEVVVPRELLAQRYQTQRTFSIVIGSVAALALLVGGIGIMNIMLTSVVERTLEIGIRRTVGATRRDITMQFLVESLLMTAIGGMAGILVGVAASWAITGYAGWRTTVSPAAVALGLVVSSLIGLAFGIYPAIKAARLEPVDALRYE
jgi:putative ABC transport system permease protein